MRLYGPDKRLTDYYHPFLTRLNYVWYLFFIFLYYGQT